MHNDTVHEAPYCIVCRRSSSVKWRKHVFTRGHQKAAQRFLLLQVNRLQTLSSSDALNSWRCVFCDAALARAAALTHCSSDVHRKRVDAFCQRYNCDGDRQIRSQLWLQKMRISTSIGDDQAQAKAQGKPQRDARSERIEAFLSSATLRLQEVHEKRGKSGEEIGTVTREEQRSLLGPQLVLARAFKTVTSSEGLLQNPLGRHKDQRVWGGGIVKGRKTEWIPWAIDQLVQKEQAHQPDMQLTGMAGATIFTHRVTEVAQGEGLSSITPVSWGACVGNVHTAAVPPWMVQTEEEYKKCNQRKQAAPAPVVATGLTKKAEKKRRDIFSALQSKSECGPDWLPNFGGVWQEGPRSKTKQAFRKAANAAKPSPDRDRGQLSKYRPSQLPVQTLLQRGSLENSQALQPPPAVQESVPGLKQKVSSEREDNESKTRNPLDTKKQLLLAQKERLRAKMAAKRRQ